MTGLNGYWLFCVLVAIAIIAIVWWFVGLVWWVIVWIAALAAISAFVWWPVDVSR